MMDMQLAALRDMGAVLRERAADMDQAPAAKSASIDLGLRTRDAMAKGEPLLFNAKELNRAVISKVVAPKSAEILLRPHQLATKILVPYEDTDPRAKKNKVLNRPGRYFFYGQRFFDETLEHNVFGGLTDRQKADDIRVLAALNAIPSLDSFLIRDKFEAVGIHASSVYTGISPDEWWAMRGTIMEEFRPLAQQAFGANSNLEARTSMLVDKIWDATDMVALAPLTNALKLNPETAPDVYYAWKGIIYYKQQYKASIADIAGLTEVLTRVSKESRGHAGRQLDWESVNRALKARIKQLQTFFTYYDNVSADIWTRSEDVSRFVELLRNGPEFFYLLGANVATIDHVAHQLRLLKRYTFRAGDFADEAYDSIAGVLFTQDGAA